MRRSKRSGHGVTDTVDIDARLAPYLAPHDGDGPEAAPVEPAPAEPARPLRAAS